MKNIISTLTIATLFIGMASCKKETKKLKDHNNLSIQIEHVWGMNMIPFSMNTWYIHPQSNDSLKIEEFAYYISNIKLKKSDGTYWEAPERFHLVNGQNLSSLVLNFSNVPDNTYEGISFTLGIDSISHINAPKTGDLDPSNGMYWNEEKGYVFVKTSGNSPTANQQRFEYLLGGYKGEYNALQIKEINFAANALTLKEEKKGSIKIKVNAARFWHGAVKTADYSIINEPSAISKQMLTNFAAGIVLSSVE